MEYQEVWKDAVMNENGSIKFNAGYFYVPVEEERDGIAEYFREVERCLVSEDEKRIAKAAANWLNGPVKEYMKRNGLYGMTSPSVFIESDRLRELINLVEFSDFLDFGTAKREVFPDMIETGERAWEVMERKGLMEKTDESEVDRLIDEVLTEHPEKVEEYRKGKTSLLGMFMGEIMRGKKGLNAKKVNEKLRNKLNSRAQSINGDATDS